MKHLNLLAICLCFALLNARSKDEWKSRTVYQLLTDRFAKGDGSKGGCDLHYYCGGDYQGITKHLDYIQNLGFDAIWISPVVDNYDNGYHGYWARNIYRSNTHFGSSDDLKRFVDACHARDIWVMVDVVANHMGNTDDNYSQNAPFTDRSHYHDYCIISDSDFATHNLDQIRQCRLSGLADLNSENPYVQQELLKWINWLIKEYRFDGARIDTIMMVPTDFWRQFAAASGVYTVGEAFDGDMQFIAQFMDGIDGLLNYPLFYTLRDTFLHQRDMTSIENYYNRWTSIIGNGGIQYLGNFNDNHDNIRFLNDGVTMNIPTNSALTFSQAKKIAFQSITAFTLTSVGIPMIYYGSEQLFSGASDPYNREVLWNNLDQNSEMYQYIKRINEAKRQTKSSAQEQIQRYSDAEVYAFSRGQLFAAFSSKQDRYTHKVITYHPYSEGQRICNIFFSTDCVKVINNKFDLYLNNGEVKIFIPA